MVGHDSHFFLLGRLLCSGALLGLAYARHGHDRRVPVQELELLLQSVEGMHLALFGCTRPANLLKRSLECDLFGLILLKLFIVIVIFGAFLGLNSVLLLDLYFLRTV